MYKLSYEKCVCFIFLVIVAILSCSGFRIDSLAMTDISKRNSYTSHNLLNPTTPPSGVFLNRLFSSQNIRYNREQQSFPNQRQQSSREGYPSKRYSERRHRIRHFRHQHRHEEAHNSHLENPSGRIDTLVIRPNSDRIAAAAATTINPLAVQRLAQIPPSDAGRALLPTTPGVVTRSQRSSDKGTRQRGGNRPQTCQEQDVARKAYLANTVVLARAESKSPPNRLHNYSVSFKILKRLKNSTSPVDDHVRLTFSYDSKSLNCETDGQERSRGLVKAKIEQSKEYFLFLNAYGAHNYSVYGMPVLYKKKLKKSIDRVISPNFELKPPKIANLTKNITSERKLKLVCKTKGFPIPYLSWKKDSTSLQHSNRTRITYKRRKTTLVIKNLQTSDFGHYECVARGVDGRVAHKSIHIDRNSISTTTNSEKIHGKECPSDFKANFCYNGGKCFYLELFDEYSCICAEGYGGRHCEEKQISNQSSMYGLTPYTCKLGLSTKYYC